MKILVRLPNWLGDLVMSTTVLRQLPILYPGAEISVIVKKGIHPLLDFFPPTQHQFLFDKSEYRGVKGVLDFGKQIKKTGRYDLFISLPNSFSSALMGMASGARLRIGYKKEMRQLLLTHSYTQPEGIHRAEEYTRLLELFTNKTNLPTEVRLEHQPEKKDHVVVNINSEASSRRLTTAKAIELLQELRNTISHPIVLIGAPKEKEFVSSVVDALSNKEGIENRAGDTSLSELAGVLASAQYMVTTDSGPAHLANALGTHTLVLFGAGNENHTAPYNRNNRTIVRLGELSCEPCEKNVCYRFNEPQCLVRLDSLKIAQAVKMYLQP